MIAWFADQDAERVYLDDGFRAVTYGEMARLIQSRPTGATQIVHPGLDIASVARLWAAFCHGTAIIVPPRGQVPDHVGPFDASMVVFTSGTTGRPKAVMLTHANWESAAKASMAHLGHGPEDTWLLALPLHHVAGLGVLIRSAVAGGRVRMLAGFHPEEFASMLREVTMASVVPTMLSRVLETDPAPYANLRAVLVGGGPIPDGLLERAADYGLPVLPTYGMTETCGQVATLRPGAPMARRAHTLPGVEVRLGEGGRIELRGPMVSSGYLGEPPRRPGEWMVTQDVGQLDDEGALTILGRADDIIVTGGEKVSPAQVEASIISLEGVLEAFVVGIDSKEWGTEVGCVYTGSLEPGPLLALISESLPRHMVPKRLLRVDTIPVSSTGKPDRSAARIILLEGQ